MQVESGAQDVWLSTSDGLRLHACLVYTTAEEPGSRLVTLYLHGNGANLAHRPGHLREIADAGYDHLIGMGYQPAQIVVHGESLGTAVAVDLACRRPCAGVIPECPLTSVSAVAATIVPLAGRLFATGFNTLGEIAGALLEAANEPKSSWAVEGATHTDIVAVAGPLYRARLQAFYESILPRPAAGTATLT